MKRELAGGFELDDDRGRIDVDAVHAFLSEQSYWARGRSRTEVERHVREADRVVGLYFHGNQVGFARTSCVRGMPIAYLFDVYVLPEFRGRGLGVELVRETVDAGPFESYKWLLDTDDAHALYAKFGFRAPDAQMMVRALRGADG